MRLDKTLWFVWHSLLNKGRRSVSSWNMRWPRRDAFIPEWLIQALLIIIGVSMVGVLVWSGAKILLTNGPLAVAMLTLAFVAIILGALFHRVERIKTPVLDITFGARLIGTIAEQHPELTRSPAQIEGLFEAVAWLLAERAGVSTASSPELTRDFDAAASEVLDRLELESSRKSDSEDRKALDPLLEKERTKLGEADPPTADDGQLGRSSADKPPGTKPKIGPKT
jgi:hypothetical protein